MLGTLGCDKFIVLSFVTTTKMLNIPLLIILYLSHKLNLPSLPDWIGALHHVYQPPSAHLRIWAF